MTNDDNNNFCYWNFIQKYYPKYDSCDNILLSDILFRKINKEEICEEDEEMIKYWDVKAELLKIDKRILSEALENYFEIIFPANARIPSRGSSIQQEKKLNKGSHE